MAPNPETITLLVSSCCFLCPIHWKQVLSRVWSWGWSSTDRRCSNHMWVINNFCPLSYVFIIEVWRWWWFYLTWMNALTRIGHYSHANSLALMYNSSKRNPKLLYWWFLCNIHVCMAGIEHVVFYFASYLEYILILGYMLIVTDLGSESKYCWMQWWIIYKIMKIEAQ